MRTKDSKKERKICMSDLEFKDMDNSKKKYSETIEGKRCVREKPERDVCVCVCVCQFKEKEKREKEHSRRGGKRK